jgi:hypothetical protein
VWSSPHETFGLEINLARAPRAPKEFKNLILIINLPVGIPGFRGGYWPPVNDGTARICINYGNVKWKTSHSADDRNIAKIEKKLGWAGDLIKKFAKSNFDKNVNIPLINHWIDFVENNGDEIFQSIRTTFMHEYVHHLDFLEKISKGESGFPKQIPRSYSRYFNTDSEIKAYSQQALYNVEMALIDSKNMDDVKRIIGNSPIEFINKKFKKFVHAGFDQLLYKKHSLKFSDELTNFWLEKYGEYSKKFGD